MPESRHCGRPLSGNGLEAECDPKRSPKNDVAFPEHPNQAARMSQAGSQAWAFYRDVAKNGVVWTVEDDVGYPAPMTASGQRAQPFWSSRLRVERVIAGVAAYAGFRPVEISWATFESEWLPDLERDGLLIGVNWSGPRATGYDIEPAKVKEAVLAMRAQGT